MSRWRLAWRLAWRDLSPRLRGLRLLALCLFLGVATLAAIGSLSASISGEISARGQQLLGGDVEIAVSQREADADQIAAFAAEGQLSTTLRTRAMARRVGPSTTADAPEAVLTELKGVDGAYPLVGELETDPAQAGPLSADSLWIAPALAERLGVGRGDRLRYGAAEFRIAGLIRAEPDRVGEGFTLGPVAITSLEGLRRTELIQPGSLYTSKYRLLLPPGSSAEGVVERFRSRFPAAGFEYRTRDRAAPGTDRFFGRLGEFLTLIGLAALAIAGIGVGNGVTAYLATRRTSIATMKVLGATSSDISRIHGLQILLVSLAAIIAGLIVGAAVPPLVVAAAGDLLPVQPGFALHPLALATSGLYGLLIALLFALAPLSHARHEPAAALFRARVGGAGRLTAGTIGAILLIAGAILALAIGTSRAPLFAAGVLGAIGGTLALLLGLGVGLRWIAARLPRAQAPLLRLAIANLHRPGAQTASLVVALGLALTLFVTLAALQTSLDAEVRTTVPERAPGQFVLDIPAGEADRFRTLVDRAAPGAALNMVPTLRGTITAYGAQRVADLAEIPDNAWFLRGERGITYAATLPEGSELVAGDWWPADYAGPPLVSLDVEAAEVLGLKVGDTLTVSILGREFVARIASLRQINWETMGFNYVLVFSPNTLVAAPHTLTATIDAPGDGGARATRAILAGFPGVSVIEVREVIEQAGTLLRQMAAAIFGAASIAILGGVAVLIGAIAAGREARAYDSVILKTLGATRRQILLTQAIEYALIAALLALLALALGSLAAWAVMTQIFDFGFAPDWGVVGLVLILGAAGTLAIALAGSWPLLSVRPSRALRQL